MKMANEAMVELCQQLMNTNQEQGKKIAKLITQIESLTKLLESPPQEEEKK